MHRSIPAALLSLLLLAGCRCDEQIIPVEGGRAVDAAHSVNEFAVDLYRELAAGDGNLFFSPTSISTALAMTWAGTAGGTAEEAAVVLHLGSDRQQVLADYSQLLAGLAGNDTTFTLNVANRLWGQTGLPFHSSYLTEIQKHFGGGFESSDFRVDPEKERLAINHWVAKQTADKIQDLLPAGTIDRNTRLVLTNAVYFLGNWLFPFPYDRTSDEEFHLADGSTMTVPTMKLKKHLPYFSNVDLAMVALPYVGDDLEFLVVLPNGNSSLPEIEASLTADGLKEDMETMTRHEVDVWLPRLDLSQAFNLNSALKRLGLRRAFIEDQADFSGMTDQKGLFISSVVHKSFLKVDEQGTEAAAATGVTIGLTSMPMPQTMFVADHPFLFLIRQKDTGVILFMGRLEDPGLSGSDRASKS